jgi:hypothetical protein
MQGTGEIVVEFSILADEDQADVAYQAATSLQSSTNPLSLRLAGQTGKSCNQVYFRLYCIRIHLNKIARRISLTIVLQMAQ